MASALPSPATRNRLLSALPRVVLAQLWPELTRVELALREVLHEAGKPIAFVLFPETICVSMLAYMEDGDAAEVGIIGRDGVVGLAVLLGGERDDLEAMMQNQGTALRMEAGALRETLDAHPVLRSLLLRYALVHHTQVARTAACNAHHSIEQRFARWLLISHDAVEGDTFPMRQEFLSMMLGVRRAGISSAAAGLRRAGMIDYGSGQMTVTDRPGLERVGCECYGTARRASDRLFGLPDGARGLQRA
ncbi:Crp/Fnr family transcriptional regulator [Pararoseomonas indoligenes]|uniref:Crp/Fnr family transcriptional regulator n=1 Tax=Roseomonas indoligenes TaxID=2820811 RepID=A0A940N2A4_9PROT|nr:Crp/Fnr family transcriptional regulator [Pararoseomonas indoligenes]MBP0495435.1 Crp/Fnr family transcriptional regulator [Pararoseomonas indoligenes]